MADHNKPGLGDGYANWPALLKARMDSILCWLDGGTETNLPTGSKRWNAGGWLEKWTGTAWQQLDFKKLTINGVELTAISSFIKGLLDDADAASARATLGAASTDIATSMADGLMSSADKSRLSALSGRNRIINGAMRIDQRNSGAAQTITAGAALAYCADRHYAYCTGANVTGQQIAIANGQSRYRFTGAVSNTGIGFGHRIEAANCRDLAGKTVTLQGKFAATSLTSLGWAIYYAGSTDTFGTLASPSRTPIAAGSFTLSATESTQSVQIDIPSAATTGLEIVLTGGALIAGQTLTIGDLQIEVGSTASTFEHVNVADDLCRCQRYFEVGSEYRSGVLATGTSGISSTSYKTQKRGAPQISLATAGLINVTAVTVQSQSATGFDHYPTVTTAGQNARYQITWSANVEL